MKTATGGDTLAIVEEARRRLERHPARTEIKTKLVLLDRDRLDQDIEAGRDPRPLALQGNITLVFQDPNLEGLLLRLHPGQERRRVAPQYKADGRETAWFFLDAVDELKLTEGKLDRALRELAKVIDGHTHRARVNISCRPSDWCPHLDLTDPPFVPAHRGSESPELSSSDDHSRSPHTSSGAPPESRPEE